MENTSQYYSQDTSYSTDGNGHIFHGFVRAWEKNYFIIKSISTLVNKRNNKLKKKSQDFLKVFLRSFCVALL